MTEDTIEVNEEKFKEFMSILDGVLDSIYGNGYGEQVKQLDDLRESMKVNNQDSSGTVRTSRGHVKFDASVTDEFLDLFIETVEQSEFIETEWKAGDPMHPHDVLVVYEVQE